MKNNELYCTPAGMVVRKGYDVYITADHGNTPCVGMGKLMKTEVGSKRKVDAWSFYVNLQISKRFWRNMN